MKRGLWLALFFVVVLLAGTARSHRLRDVFVDGKIYFLDADCYSRMTRVLMVAEGRSWTIRHHDFENWPQGITPHTTAPLDWLIVALSKLVKPGEGSVLRGQSLDLAGALIGPVLGMIACAFVALSRRSWWTLVAAGFVAVSPILVHGTSLGRPDHQALLIALVAAALALEWRLLEKATRGVAAGAGVLWGVAWWVSLYEPLVLFALVLVALAVARPAAFRERERWWGWAALLAVFGVSVLIDGWRVALPAAELREAFARWRLSIGELHALDASLIFRWLGWACVLAPLALGWQWRRAEARWLLVLLVATFALTCWQLRWGYFLALIFALSLPIQVEALARRRWLAGVVMFVGLWPMAAEWDAALFNDDPLVARERLVQRMEAKALRAIAEEQGARNAGPFVAPWWLSPAISYWSGQPGVAGSSHQSLPGILDSARIFLAPDAGAALALLRERRVAWVLADVPERVVPTSSTLLGVAAPEDCFAHDLMRAAFPEPWTLLLVPERSLPRMENDIFKVWRVRGDTAPASVPAK
ncbi:MAG: hypothetical protein ABMA13_15135 [Chthoniobacteraceae bacterium]